MTTEEKLAVLFIALLRQAGCTTDQVERAVSHASGKSGNWRKPPEFDSLKAWAFELVGLMEDES